MKESERSGARITVRVSNTLRAAIEAAAAKDRRSVANWVILRLEDATGVINKDPPTLTLMPAKKSKK